MTLALDKYRLKAPLLVRDVSFDVWRAEALDILKAFWSDTPALQEIAPNFDTWMVESPFESVMVRFAAFYKMVMAFQLNDWSRALLLVPFAEGEDLDKVAASEGLERFPFEPDERLQERIMLWRLARNSFGSDHWYTAKTRNADGRVRDVALTGNGRRKLEIAVLSTEGDGSASEELLGVVKGKVDNETVRRGNDILSIVSAVIASVSVKASVTLFPDASPSLLDGLDQTIIARWNAMPRLGLDLTPFWLKSQFALPGIYGVELDIPAFEIGRSRAVGIQAVEIVITGRAR